MATARAQVEEGAETGRVSAGVFVGGNYLDDEVELGNSFFNDQVPGSGFLVGLRAAFAIVPHMALGTAVDPRLSLELEGKLTFSSTEAMGPRESESAPVVGWRAHGVLDLFQRAPVVPFALVGVGGETVFGADRYLDSPDTDSLVYGGLGARFPLTPALELRGDLRLGLTAGRFDTFATDAEVHVGISYRFAAAAEPAERIEVVVVEPEGDADADGDGIPDKIDRCPQEAEIVNEIDDTDGCPEIDSDGDGLLGSRDSCPAAAEDVDGHEDDDGCPDLDNDGDGVEDVVDACPSEPETHNGFEDGDGCADEVPERVKKFTGTIEGITFKSGSARIQPRSVRTLEAALAVLEEYPSVRLEVSGHTDSRGSRDTNMELSRKRADYVKWFLVDKGIDADRIETVGFGPDKPRADNDTRAGRAKNRRIEFRLLSGPATKPEASETEPATPAEAPAATPEAPE